MATLHHPQSRKNVIGILRNTEMECKQDSATSSARDVSALTGVGIIKNGMQRRQDKEFFHLCPDKRHGGLAHLSATIPVIKKNTSPVKNHKRATRATVAASASERPTSLR